MYERLRRVYVSLREEERACQVLAAVGVHALCRSFDMSVEKKQGISNLELLYQEISRAEKAKEHKREQKKLKKKKKKNEKKNSHRMCDHNNDTNSVKAEDDHQDNDVGNSDEEEDLHEYARHENSGSVDECDEKASSDHKTIVDDKGAKRKTVTAGQRDTEEDAGVVCDHQEEIDDVTEEQCYEVKGKLYSQEKTSGKNQEQQKLQKKRKQKQKTPLKKNSSSANDDSKVIKTCKSKSFEDEHEVSKTSASTNTAMMTTSTENGNLAAAVSTTCNDCQSPQSDCPCESDIKDSGYGSEPLSHGNSRTSSVVSSPEDTSEGSEVSCSEGFCNHENSGGNSLLVDLGAHQHQYGNKHDISFHSKSCDQSFGKRSDVEPCYFFHQHQMNTLSLQQMLVSFFNCLFLVKSNGGIYFPFS